MTGPIGHGKTTFASALAELEPKTIHLESSMVVAEVANAMHEALQSIPDPYSLDSLNNWLRALPAILLQIVHVHTTFDDVMLTEEAVNKHPVEYQKLLLHVENLRRDPELAKKLITNDNKETYRPFLQWLGGYLVKKVDSGIWYHELTQRIYKARSGGYNLCIVGGLRYPEDATILRTTGAKIIKVYRPGHLQYDMLDPTERERENIQPDTTIISTGSIEDVMRCAKHFLKDLVNDKLQSSYQTTKA